MAQHANGPAEARPAATAANASLAGEHSQPDKNRPETLTVVEHASDLERAWFKRHPSRAHRVPPMLAGENPETEQLCRAHGRLKAYVAVKQITSGLRMKVALLTPHVPCSYEECAADLWRQAALDRLKEFALEAAAIALRARS
jgi:hypothetical protein